MDKFNNLNLNAILKLNSDMHGFSLTCWKLWAEIGCGNTVCNSLARLITAIKSYPIHCDV